MRHLISRQKINQFLKFLIMISNFDFLAARLPDIIQKYFCTPDGATDPTFQMRYVSAIQHVHSGRYYSKNLGCIFFGTPCTNVYYPELYVISGTMCPQLNSLSRVEQNFYFSVISWNIKQAPEEQYLALSYLSPLAATGI